MPLKESYIASHVDTPIRLQEFGVNIFHRITTKSALKKALKKKLIYVNGVVATSATFIMGGELLEYYYEVKKVTNTRLKLTLDVVYEDDYLAIINKPAGLLVSGNSFKTVANALVQNLKKSTAPDAITPQPVHRLDYATTGLLLVGKTVSCITALNTLFADKKVLKTYFAVTIGVMKPTGIFTNSVDGKVAVSLFEVVDAISSKRFSRLNLVRLNPKTGRRHQLRKHLLANGTPILGDALYFLDDLKLKGKGLYLHAHALQFCHPVYNTEISISSNLPKKFQKLFPTFNS